MFSATHLYTRAPLNAAADDDDGNDYNDQDDDDDGAECHSLIVIHHS